LLALVIKSNPLIKERIRGVEGGPNPDEPTPPVGSLTQSGSHMFAERLKAAGARKGGEFGRREREREVDDIVSPFWFMEIGPPNHLSARRCNWKPLRAAERFRCKFGVAGEWRKPRLSVWD